ncbi:hypothetical protein SAMN05414137_109304 [Streptacidiphilus jiangxiensis]|uniref:Uncharacterized protein n=1 Tax=Streptacidiphilus jiangxiensis TaxID=235985 RepID=A0A1H7R1Q1_STRJI|nr:hypothetical protein SAMN05414137_109304 [Streptacidiphilus jiangxiensis]
MLGAWLDEVGNPDTSAITAAVRPVVTDIQRLDFADLPARCTGLAQVVVTLQQHRPVPDAAAETQWSKALADLHLAATTCVPAAGRQDVTGLHRTGNAMMAAVGEFTAFATRISQLSS